MKTKILLIAILLILSSCSYFRVITESPYTAQSIKQFEDDGKYLVLQRGDWAWHAYDLSVHNDTLMAKLNAQLGYHIKYLYPKEEGLNRFDKGDEPQVINSVHIFTADTSFGNFDTLVAMPVSSIYEVRSYAYDRQKSRASIFVPLFVGPVALLVLVVIIAAATNENTNISMPGF